MPLKVDQRGWLCCGSFEASYTSLLQGDMASHSSLTCLTCLGCITEEQKENVNPPIHLGRIKVQIQGNTNVEMEGKMNNHYSLVFCRTLYFKNGFTVGYKGPG